MSGFGVSAVDLAKAIKLSREIYTKCFKEVPASKFVSICRDDRESPTSGRESLSSR